MRLRESRVYRCTALLGAFLLAGCSPAPTDETTGHAPGLTAVDRYTLRGERHLVHDYRPVDSSGLLNVVVEIPTGTNAKWEVDATTGHLGWKRKDGKPKVIAYLSYPGNYGMIPRTLLPKDRGGDGDPLDVIVLGPAVPRGSVIKARLLGVLRALDDGEQDDKLIAVLYDSPLDSVSSLEELSREFGGITEILQIWFANYKGPGEMELRGYAGRAEAEGILQAAMAAYLEQQ